MSGNPMKRLSSFPAGKATMEDTWESPQQQVLGLTMLHSVLKCNAPDNAGLIYCDSVADCARPTCCTLACQDLKEISPDRNKWLDRLYKKRRVSDVFFQASDSPATHVHIESV